MQSYAQTIIHCVCVYINLLTGTRCDHLVPCSVVMLPGVPVCMLLNRMFTSPTSALVWCSTFLSVVCVPPHPSPFSLQFVVKFFDGKVPGAHPTKGAEALAELGKAVGPKVRHIYCRRSHLNSRPPSRRTLPDGPCVRLIWKGPTSSTYTCRHHVLAPVSIHATNQTNAN